jgi:hypothetical protein
MDGYIYLYQTESGTYLFEIRPCVRACVPRGRGPPMKLLGPAGDASGRVAVSC